MILNYIRIQRNPYERNILKDISSRLIFEKIDSIVDEVAEVLDTLIEEGKVKRWEKESGNPICEICEET